MDQPGTAVKPKEDMLIELLTTHGATLRRIAWAYAGETGEEDDLYQEILVQLWRSLPSYRGEASAGTWLYRVATNTGLAWRRAAGRRERRTAQAATLAHGRAVEPPGRSQAAILSEFMASLGDIDRTVLVLCMEGLSNPEIAGVTGMTAGSAAVRVHRLKRKYEETYVER